MELSRSGTRRERKSARMAGRSVRLKRKASRARLTRSFSQNRQGLALGLSRGVVTAAPLALTPDDLFDHVDRLSVYFVVDPGHHHRAPPPSLPARRTGSIVARAECCTFSDGRVRKKSSHWRSRTGR